MLGLCLERSILKDKAIPLLSLPLSVLFIKLQKSNIRRNNPLYGMYGIKACFEATPVLHLSTGRFIYLFSWSLIFSKRLIPCKDFVYVFFQIQCHQCSSAADLPKTRRTRRPIPATYPNSRWQIDLKKMPPCRGFSYILNVVDCFSRFGFGRALKGKTAKEVAEVLVNFIYLYGAPRIVQSGKNNCQMFGLNIMQICNKNKKF